MKITPRIFLKNIIKSDVWMSIIILLIIIFVVVIFDDYPYDPGA